MNYISKLAAVDHVRELVSLIEAADDTNVTADLPVLGSAIDAELADLALICAPVRSGWCCTLTAMYAGLRKCLRRLAEADVRHALDRGFDRDEYVGTQLESVAADALSFLIGTVGHKELVDLLSERAAKFRDVPVDFTRPFLKEVAR